MHGTAAVLGTGSQIQQNRVDCLCGSNQWGGFAFMNDWNLLACTSSSSEMNGRYQNSCSGFGDGKAEVIGGSKAALSWLREVCLQA